MKRTLQLVLALSFISLFMVSSVSAATSQGFEWGVGIDNEFVYRFTMVDGEGVQQLNELMNLTVTGTPSIPDTMSSWFNLPMVTSNMVYHNGSSLGIEALVFLGLFLVGSHWVVPTGNYDLLSTFANDSIWWTANHTVISQYSYWGIQYSVSAGDTRSTATMKYLKSDGVATHYVIEMTNTTSGVTSDISVVRQNIPLDIVGLVMDNLLIVGAGLAIIVILAVVCKRR